MTDGRHLEKSQKGHYFCTQFGTLTYIGTRNPIGTENFLLLKILDGGEPPFWKIEKRP